jgi:hypothetical protein
MTLKVQDLITLEKAITKEANAIESLCIIVEESGLAKETIQELAFLIWRAIPQKETE